jgi:integrase/recombinase XerD
MDEIRHNEYFTDTLPPPKEHCPQESEDTEVVSLPFRIYLEGFKETQTNHYRSHDKAAWFSFLLEKLRDSELQDKDLIEKYLRHQHRRMCKKETVTRAYTTIEVFLAYLNRTTGRSLREMRRSDLEAFIEGEQDRGLKPATVQLTLATLRAFLHFLIEEEELGHEILSRTLKIKLPEALPRAIAPAEVRQFLSVIEKVRDRALFLLLVRTGMRIGELLEAKISDVNMQEQTIMVFQAPKTATGRVVYFSDDAKKALESWLTERDLDVEFLFYGYGARKLSYGGARELFKKYVKKAGLAHKGYTLHCLRHTCASELLNAGMRLEYLQKLLGHTTTEVTRRYARLTDKSREKEYFKAMERIEKGEIDGDY